MPACFSDSILLDEQRQFEKPMGLEKYKQELCWHSVHDFFFLVMPNSSQHGENSNFFPPRKGAARHV